MKPPAFQFYADDFMAGVSDMTQAEVGAYILLLCHQWSRGEIPADATRAAMIAKGEVPPHVAAKFPAGKNERMERERAKQAEWRQTQSSNGKAGAARRWHGEANGEANGVAINMPMANGMAKHSSPSPSPSPSPLSDSNNNKLIGQAEPARSNFTPPLPHEVATYSASIGYPMDGQAWCDAYAQKGWLVGKSKMKDWRAAVRNWKSQKWLPSAKATAGELPAHLDRF